ncbi:MAG TPA: hypothetical protein PK280_00740 [Planctomycetota bacterium]|nr:hypothetical protein [Planctomycetota bacterium]
MMHLRGNAAWGAVLGFVLLAAGVARAETLEANPGNYRELIPRLKPGDTLKLAAGQYKDQLRLKELNGEEGKPIVVTGPEGGAPAVFTAMAGRNTVEISACSHVTLRSVKIDGLKLDDPIAIRLKGGGHHIALENLTIVSTTIGVEMAMGRYWDCAVRGCTIRETRTGMYIGQWQGKDPFARLVVENNLIEDPTGYCAQFKPQLTRPEDMPEGPNIIRNNVFVKTRNAGFGELSSPGGRPCLNINPVPASGRGSSDMYLIYGNVFYQNNMNDALFQGAGNIALYNNLFVNELGSTDAINFQQHVNGKIRKLWVFNNTVVCKGTGIHVGGSEDRDLHVFGNAVFAGKPLALSANVKATDNLTGAYQDADASLNAPFAKIGELDLFPKAGKLAIAKDLDWSGVREFSGWDLDFNGVRREKPFHGAYAGEGQNPGWKLELGIKKPAASKGAK